MLKALLSIYYMQYTMRNPRCFLSTLGWLGRKSTIFSTQLFVETF